MTETFDEPRCYIQNDTDISEKDMVNFCFVEQYTHHKVEFRPYLTVKLRLEQVCNYCGKRMYNCIVDHVHREHADKLVEVNP